MTKKLKGPLKRAKHLAKPSKQRKWNRAQRKLLNLRRLWRMPDPNAERNYVKFLPELKEKVVHPKFFNYNFIALFLRQARYVLRKFYGNISERQYNRIHRWFWSERKNRRQTMPYAYLDLTENKFMQLLQRAKWLSKPLWLKFFLRDSNRGYFLVNQNWFIRTYRNPTLKKGDSITIPLEQPLQSLLLNKLEIHNVLKWYFNWMWLVFPFKNRWERILFYKGLSLVGFLRYDLTERSLISWIEMGSQLVQRDNLRGGFLEVSISRWYFL